MTSSEPLGSAADEAARLLETLRHWVDERLPVAEADEAPATCRYCPVCQVIAAVRQGQPEVFEHMGHAMESLLAAIRAGVSAHEDHWSRPTPPDVEHIDIR